MDTINEINAFESAQSKSKDMDIHGNLYEISRLSYQYQETNLA